MLSKKICLVLSTHISTSQPPVPSPASGESDDLALQALELLCLCVYNYVKLSFEIVCGYAHMSAGALIGQKRAAESLELELSSCELQPLHGCWGLNSDPLEAQQTFFTTETSFQSFFKFFFFFLIYSSWLTWLE